MIGSHYDTLRNLGIDKSIITNYTVLLLPENIETKIDDDEFEDTIDSLSLYKILKSEGIECANSKDLGIESYLFDRRGGDIWLGTIWIIEILIIPFLISIISAKYLNGQKTVTDEEKLPFGVTEKQAHLNLRLPNGNQINYSGDVKTLLSILKTFVDETNDVSYEDD